MPTLQFHKAVKYHGNQQYEIEVDDFRVDEVGVIFAGSEPDDDGWFLLTIVPISNVVSMSRLVMPTPEDEEVVDDATTRLR